MNKFINVLDSSDIRYFQDELNPSDWVDISNYRQMTKEEVLQHDKKFRYMLLSRMQSDCEYYLNYGNRNPKRLWAGDEQRQIEYMILLHDSFKEDEKPQWLTMDEIIDYQKRMLEPVA